MFSNSRNVIITGGQWNNSSVTNERTDYNNGIDVLRRHSVPGATHDSGERFDPPKCDADTRIMIIKNLIAWVKSTQRSSSMLWLRGSAGVGKSALAQSFAELCAGEAILAGTFFFSRTSPNPKRSDGRSLFPTIAYQLLSSFPRTRKFINKAIEDDPSIFDQSLETQMRKLVVEPLNRVANSPIQRFRRFFIRPAVHLIIVDGLDECSDPAVQCELLRIIGTSLRKFPFPFRFLIASRPEAHITRTFKVGAIPHNEIDLSEDSSAAEDIGTFLRKCFNDIKSTHILHSYIPPSWPSEDNISELVRRSSCQFIYASTVIKYISSPRHQPTDRLNIILGLSPRPVKDAPYAQLDALYMHILSCVDDIPTVLIILGILIISTEGDSTSESSPATIEKLLFLRPGDVELALSDLLSVLTLEGPHQSIRTLHASLPDFLLDPSRSGDFYVDLGVPHAALARGYMRYVSEATYDLSSMRYSWNPIIIHLRKAVLTESLYRDLLDFNFFAILCRSYFRIQDPSATGEVDWSSTIEFQGYVMDWIWSFLSCIEKIEAFRYPKDIYDRHMRTFDEHLKGQLFDYLSHQDLVDALTLLSIYDDGLTPNAISLCIPEFLESAIDPSERQLVRSIDENGLNIVTLCTREKAGHTPYSMSGQQSYLVLLRSFLRDPDRSGEYFVDDVKYARAAVKCFHAVCMGNTVISTRSKLGIEHAYVECIEALLPKAAIEEELLLLILNNRILAGILHRKLAAPLEAYLARSHWG